MKMGKLQLPVQRLNRQPCFIETLIVSQNKKQT